jgi:hypothetical protein
MHIAVDCVSFLHIAVDCVSFLRLGKGNSSKFKYKDITDAEVDEAVRTSTKATGQL